MQKSNRLQIDKRAFTLFLLTISFILMVVSGILLDSVVFTNEFIEMVISISFHKVGVSIFFVIAFFHLYYNWRPFLRYFKNENGFKYLKEFVLSGLFTAIIILISVVYVLNKP